MAQVTSQPQVSIVIVDRVVRSHLFSCISSIFKHTARDFTKIEIIFVGNGVSTTDAHLLTQLAQKTPVKVALIQEANTSLARNTGAQLATGELLLFLDSDTEVTTNWLRPLLTFMHENLNCGAGQLKLLRTSSDQRFDSAGDLVTDTGFLVERGREAMDVGQFNQPAQLFSGKGAAMVVRSNVFHKIGGFDADYCYYWEEPDIFWRVRKAGFTVQFIWTSTVLHHFGTSNKPISLRQRKQAAFLGARNQIWSWYKNGLGWQRWRNLFLIYSSWLILASSFVFRGNLVVAREILFGLLGVLPGLGHISKKRNALQKKFPTTFYNDHSWWQEVSIQNSWQWYIGKAWAYIWGRPF